MTTFFLALFLALQPATAPQVIAPFENERDCREAAERANKMPAIKTQEARANGAVFACMQLVTD